jgi:hypothetical protein
MRLTVGLANASEAGRAPGLAFAPSVLSRVGLTFTRPKDCAPFKSLGVMWTELPWIDNPCCSVLCAAAVSPPGLFALAKCVADSPARPEKKLLLTRLKLAIRALLRLTLRK